MLTYPDFSKPFHIYTDASDTQLGAVITQDEKPIAFYSRKLNSAQKRYTVLLGNNNYCLLLKLLENFAIFY